MSTHIVSNYHERQFLYGYEVPQSVHDNYDWLDEDEHFDRWILYKGDYMHLSDFLDLHNKYHCNTQPDSPFYSWHGYTADSMGCGTVIRISDDSETYVIGYWYA